MKRSFSSKEVVELTGITPRQLQWWDERGLVVPARAGRRRLYSVDTTPMRQVDDWLEQFRRIWERRFDALATEIARGKRSRRR